MPISNCCATMTTLAGDKKSGCGKSCSIGATNIVSNTENNKRTGGGTSAVPNIGATIQKALMRISGHKN